MTLSASRTDTTGAMPAALSLLAASPAISASFERSPSRPALASSSSENLETRVSPRVLASMASRCAFSAAALASTSLAISASSASIAEPSSSLAASRVIPERGLATTASLMCSSMSSPRLS